MCSSPPVVTIDQGTYVGKVLESDNHPIPIEAFLGVPYAKPPTGNLRFARPVALPSSKATFQATEFGHRCPSQQFVLIDGAPKLEPSEDCLTVNVFRQQGTASTLLPVMVYIHGGAFNRGTATMHDTASMLSHSAEPFLAISFNYRIGALGFLNSAYTAEKGLLNLGLHDQILLLEWVQANAAAFGGDPGVVTLVGVSAGAHSIGHHMMNVNEKRTLFHRAVMESGAPTSRATHRFDSQLHESQFRKFVELVGISQSQDLLTALREAPIEAIIDAQNKVFSDSNPSVRWAWQPVIDNDIISRPPIEAWRSGEYHSVPVLTGFNHNEATRYVPRLMNTSQEFTAFFSTLLPQLSSENLRTLEALYPDPSIFPEYADTRDIKSLGLGSQYSRVEAAYGQYAYASPVRQTALLNSAKTWLYHWWLNKTVDGGANHGDQMWYEMMAPSVRKISPTHDAIARKFSGFVTRFVVSGDPGPEWKPFKEEGKTMLFGRGNDEELGGVNKGVVSELSKDVWGEEQCRFWAKMKDIPDA